MTHLRWILTFGIALLTLGSARAQTPLGTTFTYQGQLKNGGVAVNGNVNLTFALWDALVGGSPVGSPDVEIGVAVSDGLFTVQLNETGQFGPDAFNGEARWLHITVNGVSVLPRQPLTATPAALSLRLPYAAEATVQNGAPLHIINSFPGPLFNAYGIWGETLHPLGRGLYGLATSSTGGGTGVYGESVSSTGFGVFGFGNHASGANFGVFGRTDSTLGAAIFGRATADSGTTYGVRGHVNSPNGYAGYFDGGRNYFSGDVGIGVLAPRQQLSVGANLDLYSGSVNSPTRPSVRGSNADNLVLSASGSGAVYFNFDGGTGGIRFHDGTSAGEWMRIDSEGDVGIGTTAPTSKLTVFGRPGAFAQSVTQGNSTGGCAQFTMQSASNAGAAVRGVHFDTAGDGIGVYGEGGIGLYGYSPESTGATFGIQGWAPSRSGRSVYGRASDAPAGFVSYGILGEETAQSFGWAIYAIGDVGATGSKAFRIDHPDDPENKYLLHYCPESPEIINFYSGNVLLDENGAATVELPGYFAKVNTDPRYALTAVGRPMPDLHVAEEISVSAMKAGERADPGERAAACTFRIAGGKPGGKVSWEVKARRNDRYVQLNGAPVEVEKPALERGTYQHPELYGQPPERSMNYEAVRTAQRARAASSTDKK